jgi:HSP20 family protein
VRWHRPENPSWGSWDQLTNLREEINRLFELPLREFTPDTEFFGWAPVIDLFEDKDNLVVKAELPGMRKEDIDLSLHQNNLMISGERKSESHRDASDTSRAERFFGRFQRSIELPKPVDVSRVSASYKDGVLTVTLPKTEESKPKQIEVKVS